MSNVCKGRRERDNDDRKEDFVSAQPGTEYTDQHQVLFNAPRAGASASVDPGAVTTPDATDPT
jgi:hypothetical protein